MLTEAQTNAAWTRMVEAEVRSFYFGDLASRFTKRKQILTGINFFLSSGAAATLVAKLPDGVPIVLSIFAAISAAYSISVGLEGRIKTLTKLHYQWNQLSSEYERLWNHWHDDEAEAVLEALLKKAREASETATEMPYDTELIDKWRDMVYSRFQTPAAV